MSIRMRCRDPLMFPSFIHTQKRNPQTHLKDPDMFWDFISLRPETTHQVLPPPSLWVPLCPLSRSHYTPPWVPLCPSMGPIMPSLCVPLCPLYGSHYAPSMGAIMPPLCVSLSCPVSPGILPILGQRDTGRIPAHERIRQSHL